MRTAWLKATRGLGFALGLALGLGGCASGNWQLTWGGHPHSKYHTQTECQKELDKMVKERGWAKNSHCDYLTKTPQLGDQPVRE